jgi:hypothetical protein
MVACPAFGRVLIVSPEPCVTVAVGVVFVLCCNSGDAAPDQFEALRARCGVRLIRSSNNLSDAIAKPVG